jgi:hypothetical protein
MEMDLHPLAGTSEAIRASEEKSSVPIVRFFSRGCKVHLDEFWMEIEVAGGHPSDTKKPRLSCSMRTAAEVFRHARRERHHALRASLALTGMVISVLIGVD